MKIKMKKTYNGYFEDVPIKLKPGAVVEGKLAEHVHGKWPQWCEALPEKTKEDEKTEKEAKERADELVYNKGAKPEKKEKIQINAPESNKTEVKKDPDPIPDRPKPEAISESEPIPEREVEKVYTPNADKMMRIGDAKTKDYESMGITELRRLASKEGVKGAWRMKKDELLKRIGGDE